MAIADEDWTRLLNSARVKLVGASDSAIKNDLYDTVHEFFSLSSSWLEALSIPIVADTLTYSMVPASGQIIRLAGVVDVNGCPQPALMPTIGTLQLAYPSNTSQTFTATVVKNVVLPTDDSMKPDAPDWLLPVYGPSVLDGLLGRMMGHLSKSYSNPSLSVYHLKRFLNAVAGVRSAALARNTIGGAAWSYPRQFGRGSQRGGFSTSNTGGF